MKGCHYNVPKISDYVLKRHVKDSKPILTKFLTLRLYMWEKTDDNYNINRNFIIVVIWLRNCWSLIIGLSHVQPTALPSTRSLNFS